MKSFLILFALILSSSVRADAWDNLTHEEALNLVDYLRENPYVFDYCDCCQDGDDDEGNGNYVMQLVKITNAKIVTCEWDKEYYSVVADFQGIATLIYNSEGKRIEILPPPSDWKQTLTMYMNYTWGFNSESHLAEPLFESIDYHYVDKYGGKPCKEPFPFPSPQELNTVGNFKAYKQWYRRVH